VDMWKEQDAGTYADDNVFHCIPAQYFYDKKIVMVTSGDHQGLVTSGDADTLQISRGSPTGAWQLQSTQTHYNSRGSPTGSWQLQSTQAHSNSRGSPMGGAW